MSAIYERLGVLPIINAKGTATRLSGAPMDPRVAAAMVEASGSCVDMAQLQAAASERIAAATGAEAGIVTSGAAAGLLLATAACVAGLDPGAMARLPEIRHGKDEVIVARSQRQFYDHAVRTAGVRLVEVGIPDRYSGAGIRDAEPWEYADALTERTAAILYTADEAAMPSLESVCAVARERGVPVIVDAAAQLPPAENLRGFVASGADLVAFSGGKAIGGPQASGILCGRRDLIMSAALQMLDLDVRLQEFHVDTAFIDLTRLAGLPPHGIGRSCKVGKEQIVGLLTALDLFLAESDEARHARWSARLDAVEYDLRDLGPQRRDGNVPLLLLRTPSGRAAEVVRYLDGGKPSIRVDTSEIHHDRLIVNPLALREVDLEALALGLRRALETVA